MKKLFVLLAILGLVSACSMEEDNLKFHVEFIPAMSVETPESMVPGQTYEIRVKYLRPNDCYYFDGFYYEAEAEAHIIAVQSLVLEHAECLPVASEVPEEASFDFICSPQYAGSTYVFKFYQGEDAQGDQQFLTVEVPVE